MLQPLPFVRHSADLEDVLDGRQVRVARGGLQSPWHLPGMLEGGPPCRWPPQEEDGLGAQLPGAEVRVVEVVGTRQLG